MGRPSRQRGDRSESSPPKALLAKISRLRNVAAKAPSDTTLSDAYREVLRGYRTLLSSGSIPGAVWRNAVREALGFLGGQSDRIGTSLEDYDHHRYGPFLGVSNEGGGAEIISAAAHATPKAQALGRKSAALSLGVAVDAERLGSIGEVPVGPNEYADIWSECVGRTLMTTNVGSRVNLRFYKRAPLITIPAGESGSALARAKAALAAAFKPFLEAPGGPRPLLAFVEFAADSKRHVSEQLELLRALQTHMGSIAAPRLHRIGLNVAIGSGRQGCDAALAGIDLAHSAGVRDLSIDGTVRREGDRALSLPGLLNYLPAAFVAEILDYARDKRLEVRPLNEVDSDSVARQIWSTLTTARAMGLNLGKYGLFPLTLEQCDIVVECIQRWFPDWSAAPVFYVDQGMLSRNSVFVGAETERGIEAWLRMVAKHKVRLVLIDTVDKSQGWKILKTDNDTKGILELRQIARLNTLGEKLGVKVMWAGGITPEHAYQFGKLGVFGIYVTTAIAEEAPVGSEYARDPGLASEKQPTLEGILKVKTLLEGGFLAGALASGSAKTRQARAELRDGIERARLDTAALSKILPAAWRTWWQLASA